ncbi:hypothetical protein D9V41_12085 [Aeromicrobium phragmitis]|uniref:Uncharacterized protein n=1 Tax=Aeromicrobium phragmitis TaxID=2478914 RepID=A0A3L8PJ75_9ACTN|nr:hypothetical protein D9V41_12085 [Aeromicrobium phragmitis]
MLRWLVVGFASAIIIGWVVLSFVEGAITASAWLGVPAMVLVIAGQVQTWRVQNRRAQRGEQ